MSAHTPGPWTAHWWKRNQKTGCGEWSFTGGPQDSTILRPCKQSSAEVAANARLIAAGPEMYDYIKEQAAKGDAQAQQLVAKVNQPLGCICTAQGRQGHGPNCNG